MYSIDEISRRIRALKAALQTEVLISFKACGNYDIISRLPADCFDGIELASRGELHTMAGHKPKHFYVNTPALTDTLVRAAIGAKASFVVDSPKHLDMIAKLRGKRELQPIHSTPIESPNPAIQPRRAEFTPRSIWHGYGNRLAGNRPSACAEYRH